MKDKIIQIAKKVCLITPNSFYHCMAMLYRLYDDNGCKIPNSEPINKLFSFIGNDDELIRHFTAYEMYLGLSL